MITGVVLAGGESRRFGGNKLLALVDGDSCIARVAREASRVVDLLVVSVSRPEQCRLYEALGVFDKCIVDPPLGCGGPGAALAGLDRLPGSLYLTVPGDTPWLTSATLGRLLGYSWGFDAVTVLHEGGVVEPLLSVYTREHVERLSRMLPLLCRLRGYLRPTDAHRLAPRLLLVGSGLLANTPLDYAHINTRVELEERRARNRLTRSLLTLEPPLSRLGALDTCRLLAEELAYYARVGVELLALHSRLDYTRLCNG